MTIGRIPSVEGGIQPTIVDAKGDLIAGVAADSINRLAVGSNDQVLVADSSASTGLAWKSVATPFAAGKNKIINGDFNIWQRGTSFSSAGYTSDRWYYQQPGTGTGTLSRQSFTAGSAPVAGYENQYFAQIAVNTVGSSSYVQFNQPIEDVRTFAGQTITVSFWARNSSGSIPNPYIRVEQFFGSGGSASVNTDSSSFTFTSSWARYSATITLPSISGKTIGTNSYLGILFILPITGSTWTGQIWGVQVEAGNVATPFQTATGTLQGELAACQRYYQKTYQQSAAVPTNSHFLGAVYGNATSTTNDGCYAGVRFPVNMRIAPTVTMYSYTSSQTNRISNSAGTDQGASSAVANGIGESGFGIYNNSGGTITTTNGFIVHYQAVAEL